MDAFCKEVVMLSKVHHKNLVTFVGYCIDPFLLIVMDFVDGGTLKDYISSKRGNEMQRPSLDVVMKILIGSAEALAYLHAMDPAPVLHRDIKSENILITSDFDPRVADLGEARVMAENKTMTTVGTRGYTAPEVLQGQYYGTAADVFSYAIVMSELISLRAPYSNMLKDVDGSSLMNWEQVVKLTQTSGLRPTLPEVMDSEMGDLIRDCWAGDAGLRPSFRVIVLRLKVIRESAFLHNAISLASSPLPSAAL